MPDIKLILFDCDGVLTDGSLIVNDLGIESKAFHVRDGFAMRRAMDVGLKVGVLTGRSSRALTLRMRDLEISLFLQKCNDKAIGLEMLCQQAGVELEETAYVGDDLIDLPALLRCGYPIAVADAVEQVREVARYTTTAPGGKGAAREAIEHILKLQNKWDALLEQFEL